MKDMMLGEGLLYNLNHNRYELMLKEEKRRSFFLVCAITACVTIATTIWIIWG